jgi:AraC family transcriptional regulator of adaptative response / DNA-3-methyladenine glycosylase II
MTYNGVVTLPPQDVCDLARRTKDARFDGLFFTGVRSTHIYCRPVCPAPTPKPQHIVYFPTAAAASAAGFRPCLRCRPELAPGALPADRTVRRAVSLIAGGWLDENSVESLARECNFSARQLRRLFEVKLGATPLEVNQSRRMLLAKQLLTETSLSITQVALAAGFGSLRRFNDTFKLRCAVAPSAIRRRIAPANEAEIALRLAFRPPLNWAYALGQLRGHVIDGIERVRDGAYERSVSAGARAAWIRITAHPDKPELRLQGFGIEPREIHALVRRVRRMFDLDADLLAAHAVLVRDPALASIIARHPGRRIIGAWDMFEAAVAMCLAPPSTPLQPDNIALTRLVHRLGAAVNGSPRGIERRFPSPAEIATSDLEMILDVGPRLANRLRSLAVAVRDGALRLDDPTARTEDLATQLVAYGGMLPAQADALVVRCLSEPDSAAVVHDASYTFDSDRFRPWRTYAGLYVARSPR